VDGRDVAEYSGCKFIAEKSPLHFGEGKTLEQSRESMDEYIKWLETDAPKINDYQWKEWSQETIDKVNANLATYTSSYTAPRSTAAAVNETVKEIIDNQNNITPKTEPEKKVDEPKEENVIITDADNAWLKEVLGK
jgi:hypothetical protein